MEERLQRVIADLKAIQETLEEAGAQAQSPVAEFEHETLKELRAMADKVRRLLWCYRLGKKEEQGPQAKVLEIYCTQRIVDRLRAHRTRDAVRR